MVVSAIFTTLAAAGALLHPESPGVAVRHDPLGGLPLCVWNDAALFTTLKPGMTEASTHVYRFPNGSTSNEYHWNGTGTTDADSNWVPSDSVYTPGWQAETIFRGTSKNHYGFVRPSRIDDGDTTTCWWSNPDHPDAPGWFFFDFQGLKVVDSIDLRLGDLRPDSVQILRWTGANGSYPGPNQQSTGWQQVARLEASSRVLAKFTAVSTRYVAVRPLGTLPRGWKVAECALFRSGNQVTVATTDANAQTQVVATSAAPASLDQGKTSNWDFETYMAWIRGTAGAAPMVCVNYGTGTAQEAAAWVRYANIRKGYGIKRWQVGNEVSGDWEEGGSVSARQYAERFCKYSKAMKAADPTIQVEGPVLPHSHFTDYASGDFDGRSWAEGFLHYVDSVEKADGIRLMDGFDFHSYPYWFQDVPDTGAMLSAIDADGANYDSLAVLMGRTIADPGSREVLLTEYNTSTANSSLMQRASGGTGAGLQLAHFAQRFADRGVAVLWESFEGGGTGPDGSFGTLSMFNKPVLGMWSSLGYPPNAPFWPIRTLLREWLDTAGGDTLLPIDQVSGARLFAVSHSGRVSVVAFNLGGDSTPISLDPTAFAGGDILSWGPGEYDWNGTTAESMAYPSNGPSSRPVPASWNGTLKLPPWGFAVVRAAGRSNGALRTPHWMVVRSKIQSSDSFSVSGWTVFPGSKVAGGTWTAGNAGGVLTPTDGAWDGSMESWTFRASGADIGEGKTLLRIRLFGPAGDTIRDSTGIEVTGTLRPVLLVSNFDNKTTKTSWGGSWTASCADNSVRVRVRLDTARGIASYYLRDSVTMVQPTDMSYTVYSAATFAVPAGLAHTDSTRNLVGLVFDIATTHTSPDGTFRLVAPSRQVADYDDFYASIPNTQGAWVHDTVLWEDLHQGGWGKNVGSIVFDSISQFEFRFEGEGTTTIQLDNVAFLGTVGADYHVAVRPTIEADRALSLVGRKVAVSTQGKWSLHLVGADGRTLAAWRGEGPKQLEVPRTAGTSWLVMQSTAGRRILTIPPGLH
jgi:hypothetical protein